MARATPLPATDELVDALETIVQGMMRLARREAAAAGLSMPQFFILRRIRRWGTIPATQWARHTGTRASSASGLVDGLVRNGWVVRARDPDDRRKVLIHLSARGARLVERVDAARRRKVRTILVAMDPPGVRRAAAVAEDLARRFSADREVDRSDLPRSAVRMRTPGERDGSGSNRPRRADRA
jgi:DNA-binding MarR family transcriptional regulator